MIWTTFALKQCGHNSLTISVWKKKTWHINLCKVQPLWIFEQVWLPVTGVHLCIHYQRPIPKEHFRMKNNAYFNLDCYREYRKPWYMKISIEWCWFFSLALISVQLAWTVSVKAIESKSEANSYLFQNTKITVLKYRILK